MSDPDDYLADLEAWKTQRLAALTAPDAWLTIVSRHWLSAGSFTVGSAADCDLVLPAGPQRLGALVQDDSGEIDFTPADGATSHLVPDPHNPPRLKVEELVLEITTINGRNSLRVRDTNSPLPAKFPGLSYFPARPELRLAATWQAFDPPREVVMDTSQAIPIKVVVTRKAVFEIDGQSFTLTATHGTKDRPQFVFKDLTSEDSTYKASRFVFGEEVTDKGLVLDFNKAINPPCAFTDFAACPLPLAEDMLPVRVEAGEKRVPANWR